MTITLTAKETAAIIADAMGIFHDNMDCKLTIHDPNKQSPWDQNQNFLTIEIIPVNEDAE